MASKQTRIKGDKTRGQGQPQSKHNQAILLYGGFVREIPAVPRGDMYLCVPSLACPHWWWSPGCGIGGVSHACRGSAASRMLLCVDRRELSTFLLFPSRLHARTPATCCVDLWPWVLAWPSSQPYIHRTSEQTTGRSVPFC